MYRFVVPLGEGFRKLVAGQPRSLAFVVNASALVVCVVEKYLLEHRWVILYMCRQIWQQSLVLIVDEIYSRRQVGKRWP